MLTNNHSARGEAAALASLADPAADYNNEVIDDNNNNNNIIIIIIIIITATADLRTKILDFGGFDSGRVLMLRGESLLSIGSFPEILSQRILAGIQMLEFQ